MRTIQTTAGVAVLLLASLEGALAEDTRHVNPPTASAPAPSFPAMPMMGGPGQGSAMGMMNMMNMMGMMSQAGMAPTMVMMGPNGIMAVGMMNDEGQPAMMMAGLPLQSMGMPSTAVGFADHIEGRIAFMKAELKITDAQMSKWDAFADALRKMGAEWRRQHAEAKSTQPQATDLPSRVSSQEKLLQWRLEALRREKEPLLALYAVLYVQQKRVADQLMLMPSGMGM